MFFFSGLEFLIGNHTTSSHLYIALYQHAIEHPWPCLYYTYNKYEILLSHLFSVYQRGKAIWLTPRFWQKQSTTNAKMLITVNTVGWKQLTV